MTNETVIETVTRSEQSADIAAYNTVRDYADMGIGVNTFDVESLSIDKTRSHGSNVRYYNYKVTVELGGTVRRV